MSRCSRTLQYRLALVSVRTCFHRQGLLPFCTKITITFQESFPGNQVERQLDLTTRIGQTRWFRWLYFNVWNKRSFERIREEEQHEEKRRGGWGYCTMHFLARWFLGCLGFQETQWGIRYHRIAILSSGFSFFTFSLFFSCCSSSLSLLSRSRCYAFFNCVRLTFSPRSGVSAGLLFLHSRVAANVFTPWIRLGSLSFYALVYSRIFCAIFRGSEGEKKKT